MSSLALVLALAVSFVGDSHGTVLGPMVARELRASGVRTRVEARVGWGLRRFMRADDLDLGRPDVVVLALGSNDYGVRRARRYLPRAAWAVAAARAAGAQRIVWFGPPAVDGSRGEREEAVAANHDAIAELQAATVPRLGAEWHDSRPVTRDRWGRDGIHLTRTGYRAWAHEIACVVLGVPAP
jgi:lysophospholipase L1-like esterase